MKVLLEILNAAVKYNYVYFKYDFEHLLWFKNDFLYFNMFKIPY